MRILILFLLTSSIFSTRRLDTKPILSSQDNKNYVLSIDQRKIVKQRDIVLGGKKHRYVPVPLKFTNNTDDTLNYISLSCAWEDIYHSDNTNLKIYYRGCELNTPVIKTVLPHQSFVVILPLIFANKASFDKKFRVSMAIQKYNGKDDLSPIDYKQVDKGFVIWSNQAEIPKL